MVSPIKRVGNVILHSRARSLKLSALAEKPQQQLFKRLLKVMREYQGVGIAAPQIGVAARVIVMESQQNTRYPEGASFGLQIYINPSITWRSKQMTRLWEGCLSVPGYRGEVGRSESIILEARTPEGEKVKKRMHGFEARVAQHEIDHLNGLLYINKMKRPDEWLLLREFNRRFQCHVRDLT